MQKPKICIIDDNESVCHSLGILFDCVYQDSLDVTTYSNPVVFLEAFSPDWKGCVIIDLFMPYWNGLDLMQELKKRNSTMHVIIISGHASTSVASQALAAGALAFISKPFNVDNLLNNINEILRQHR